jgi:predicted amidophosphoribosyltransferase
MRSLALPARMLRRSAAALLDLLLPPRCLGCGGSVGGQGELCPACWRGIIFLAPPCCDCCGLPFPFDSGAGTLCGACIAEHPDFDRARAVFKYEAA